MTSRASALVISSALLASASCAAHGPTEEPAPTASVSAAAPAGPPMPFPGRARFAEAIRANEGCVTCHADVAATWAGSQHQRADLEPAYRKAFEIEPLPFCRACHAPEGDPSKDEPRDVAELGVGCVTCHVTDEGGVLAVPKSDSASDARAPHRIQRVADFASARACATCHEFRFPHGRGEGPGAFMQTTVTEHAASPVAEQACADCHMPRDTHGKRSHAFAASRSQDVLRSAVDVTAERTGPRNVRVTLAPRHKGHAFPTGDLFRRLAITAEALGPDHMVLARTDKFLARHWGFKATQAGRELVRDDRVFYEPVSFDLELPEVASPVPIAFTVTYQRVAHPNGIDDSDAEIEGEIEIASQVLAPLTPR
ncbi:MAG: multiheme c-type cytochrome [Polyangiaceae bacterium]